MAFNFWSGKYLKQNARQTSQDRVKENRKKRTEPGTKYSEVTQERKELSDARRAEIQQQARGRSVKRVLVGLTLTAIFIAGIGFVAWTVIQDNVAQKQERYIHNQFEIWYANMKIEQQKHEQYKKYMHKADSLLESQEYAAASRNYEYALRALPDDTAAQFGLVKAVVFRCKYKRYDCKLAKENLTLFKNNYGSSEAVEELEEMIRHR